MPLFADNMIIHVERLNESTEQLLELTSEFSKVSRHKVNNHNKYFYVVAESN